MKVTAKGMAFIFAVESGLIPACEEGYDDTAFNRFWADLEREYILTPRKDTQAGLLLLLPKNKRERKRDRRKNK